MPANLRRRIAIARLADEAEFGQATIRLWYGGAIGAYLVAAFFWDGLLDDSEAITLAWLAVYYGCSVAILAWITLSPGINHWRRRFASLFDMGGTTVLMVRAEEIGTVMYGMYLWVMVGNGFRYGRWYLHYAQILAVGGFITVLLMSDYWRGHPILGVGLLLALTLVPWYFSLLLARLQHARAEAEAASIAKTKFLAAASHDLRQPMQALSMYATVLEQRTTEANGQRLVHGIQLSVTTLERMFDSLLDISKIEAGVIKPNIGAFALMPLMDRVAQSERPLAAQKGLDLRIVPTSMTVLSDPGLLERMLKNLVTNAIRYTERGKIVIGCRRSGTQRVRLAVMDSGIGIALEEQQHIFDEYYQISGASAQGLGLGLPIVKSLGELLGHAVSVKSAPGRGSMFLVELPRGPDFAPLAAVNPLSVSELRRLKVAIVDDDVEIRESMALLLQSWGCCTVAAGTGKEIERQLVAQGTAPDALIVDYRLADATSGIEVIERLRLAFGPQLPALIITGTANPSQIESRVKGIPVATKPVAPGRLRAFLSAI
ncbi:MAG TPA: hybrid sensor histidine kinase/response regulator [Burkholderiales bacterium]|nr:hybrid sensor histidine kinase/response regulator [Burkholderiales bacterium]